MSFKFRMVILMMLIRVGQTAGHAETKPLEVKWTALAPLVQGQRVQMTLPDGVTLKGQAVVVREDTMLLDVRKAFGAFKKGSATIPRSSVTLIKVEGTRGSW